MNFFDHWVIPLIDMLITAYLVYYYVTNEYKKNKENNKENDKHVQCKETPHDL